MDSSEWFMLGVHVGLLLCGFIVIIGAVFIVAVLTLMGVEWLWDEFHIWQDVHKYEAEKYKNVPPPVRSDTIL